ncbi:hypothetical protein BWQ96_06890 [Gracilariopsis chorda]|uniref:Uncharacterized protein n=1 Tax=Gracilariopsis chorda TaxID=448386 RepID=A0A2V3IMT6_9FLOR|nr:hypothetical protein BWQ96_06890 [Gracilariopsis chorda]|eukprot:PXF43395.1 hypothetical protein BWQ96_06890 [Gracilariopsis chorda]
MKDMACAFALTTPFVTSGAAPAITSSWNGRRIPVTPWRRPIRVHTACLAVNKEPNASKDEEQLDEAAMRAAEIHEVMNGLKQFKDRIIEDATKLARKVRAPKKQLEAALASHPDIIRIDGHIAELEEELKHLGDR